MIEYFYDAVDDCYYATPLRNGSSFTESLTNVLHINVARNPIDVFDDLNHTKIYQIYRDPIARYTSGLTQCIPAAMLAVDKEIYELSDFWEIIQDYTPGDVLTNDQQQLVRSLCRLNSSSILPPYGMRDTHCVPVMTYQLFLYTVLDNVSMINLYDYTKFMYNKLVKTGRISAKDFYHTVDGNDASTRVVDFSSAVDPNIPSKLGQVCLDFMKNEVPWFRENLLTFDHWIKSDVDSYKFVLEHGGAPDKQLCGSFLTKMFSQNDMIILKSPDELLSLMASDGVLSKLHPDTRNAILKHINRIPQSIVKYSTFSRYINQ